ncbi:hypothetical protein EK904_001520, partial [Melospiza melodia maxima]
MRTSSNVACQAVSGSGCDSKHITCNSSASYSYEIGTVVITSQCHEIRLLSKGFGLTMGLKEEPPTLLHRPIRLLGYSDPSLNTRLLSKRVEKCGYMVASVFCYTEHFISGPREKTVAPCTFCWLTMRKGYTDGM